MDEEEQRRLGELEDARAGDRAGEAEDDEPPFDPTTGGPGLTGLTPPD